MKRILLLFIYIVFLLTVVEIALALISHYYYPRLTISDRDIGWRYTHTPHRVSRHLRGDGAYDLYINKEGFRDDEFSKTADLRIMVLGDSMTFGGEVGQDKIFCTLLEKRLQTLLRPHTVDVMNFGMPAFSTGQELLCLEKYYDRYKPNLIILMLFEANDFSDNTAMMMIGRYVPHFVIKDGNIVLKKEPSPLQRFLTFLRDHSFTFYCLQTLAERWNIYTTHELGEDETALMAKILTKMHAYAQSKGTPLLIFYIGQNPLMTQQRAAVEQLCTQSGIFYREIPYLPSERRGGMGHFNEKGHEVIDGIIYDGLLHSGVLGEFTGGGSAAP